MNCSSGSLWHALALVTALAIGVETAAAQGSGQPDRIIGNNGTSPGKGGWTYSLPQNPQSSNYAAQSSDCGKRIVFNVTAQVTLKLNSGARFPANCDITISNIGNYAGPGTARGVILSVPDIVMPNQGNVLYPGQTTVFSNDGSESAWVEIGYTQRQLWKPLVDVTFYADAANGSDAGTVDGLGPGSGANGTLRQAFIRLSNFVDYSGGSARARLSSTGNFPSGDSLHMAGPLRGGQGNAVFVWTGNGTTVVNPGAHGTCFALFDHAVAEWIDTDCEATQANAGCGSVSNGSVLFLITVAITCNPAGTGFIAADPGSEIEYVNVGFRFGNAAGTSPANMFSISDAASIVFDTAQTIRFLGNTSFSKYVIAVFNRGSFRLGWGAFDLGGNTVTGVRFVCSGFSILSVGSTPDTTIPGSINGSIDPDCFANGNFTKVSVPLGGTGLSSWTEGGIPYGGPGGRGSPDFVGPCGNNVPITGTGVAAANAPQCGNMVQIVGTTFATANAAASAGLIAHITDGKAANCGDGSCTTWGTTVNGGGGTLDLEMRYNGANWTLTGK